jgi:hypothetical protein
MMVMIYDKTGMIMAVNTQTDMAQNKTDVMMKDPSIGTHASQQKNWTDGWLINESENTILLSAALV